MDLVVFGLLAQHVGVGGAELCLVEGLAEALAALFHFLVDLFLYLPEEILDQHVGAVPLLGVLVVDQRVVEGAHVAGGLPDAGVHEDAGINAHDVLVEAGHCVPPILLYVVFQLDAHLAIVIDSGQAVVDLA